MLEVDLLKISDRVAEKIIEAHGITPQQVREAVEGVGGLPFSWHHHRERGDRAYVVTEIDGVAVQVVLYPSRTGDAREWHLGSAYTV